MDNRPKPYLIVCVRKINCKSGLLLGWICGAVLGVIAFTINRKQKQVIVTVLSVVSITPILICLILFIPYFLFKIGIG